jgi:thiamine kinase-like enzyme
MATLKKPKKKKYPKKPKANASAEQMTKYLEKVKAIDKQFTDDTSDYNKEFKKRSELKAKIGKVTR